MIWKILIITILLILTFWAIKSRINIKRRRAFDTMEAAVASPTSVAIGELIAIAGGIYLSLMLVVSFLKITLPETITVSHLQIDPLAMIAIVIALLQPIFISLYSYCCKR